MHQNKGICAYGAQIQSVDESAMQQVRATVLHSRTDQGGAVEVRGADADCTHAPAKGEPLMRGREGGKVPLRAQSKLKETGLSS